MKILIIGLGYAGTRFLHAFRSAQHENIETIAYVGRRRSNEELPFFDNVKAGLLAISPDLVVLSVNDVYRMEVMAELAGFKGFIICEKPFVCPWDDLNQAAQYLSDASGFCLDLVERYSPITAALKKYVQNEDLELLRANFTWGKNRIGDHRPTCGVTSEIIHPLDIVQYVCDTTSLYEVKSAHGTCSDFSVSGERVIDSVSVLARLGSAPVFGYASFVNVMRRREIGFVFARRSGGLVYATMLFDEPVWDVDELRVWTTKGQSEVLLMEKKIVQVPSADGSLGIQKLVRLVGDVIDHVQGHQPRQPFPDLEHSVRLQGMLNDMHRLTGTKHVVSLSKYGNISIETGAADWERLG